MTSIWLFLSLLIMVPSSFGYPTGDQIDPEEIGGFFEGDLDLTDEQFSSLRSRNGLISRSKRWPNKLVLYKISPQFDPPHKSYIEKAIKTLDDKTCLSFKEAGENDTSFINITAAETGCHSAVGYQNNIQSMNLQIYPLDKGCFRMGSILHELLHTLGFYHQQSASDRDGFITVVEDNIIPGMEYNFQQQSNTENFGIPYDYSSVLHYSNLAFSKNGEKTILTIDPKAVIGQRNGLSQKDLAKVNTMYLCPIQV